MIKSWDVHETFRLEPDPDGGADVLLRSVLTGRYAVVDRIDGRIAVTADTAREAERWQRELLRDGIAEARAAAETADVAVVVLGNHPLINGRETEDRTGIALPEAQENLVRAVASARPETVLLMMSSYPYALDWADDNLPAVVWTSHGGQESGRALAAVLLGDAEPAGRLPQTWYRGDVALPHPLDYDIIKAGWTYQYHRHEPRYAFGHGLSYTEFSYHDLRLSAPTMAHDGSVEVTVTLANTGARAGTEVVQLYVRALEPRYDAPRLRLADFRKVRLDPGERRELTFALPAERFAHWDVSTGAFAIDPGSYEVVVARSAEHVSPDRAAHGHSDPAPGPWPMVEKRVLAADFDDYTGIELVDASPDHGDAVTPANGNSRENCCSVP